jgi:peptidyl-prolyl cis-trans isomerase C
MNLKMTFALSALVALAGCKQASTPAADTSASTVKPVATVNGTPISRDAYEYYIKNITGKTSADLTPAQRNEALDSLVRGEVVAQQAVKDGLDKKGDAASGLMLSRLQLLQQAASESFLKDRKSTDAELKAEYDTQVAAMPRTQYKAHHILVKTEPEAQAALARIKKGEKFEAVAKAVSIDTSSKNGGDLGDFFSPASMVKPFADAVVALKKGETTDKPVQTDFGFHIIRLDDMRETVAPPFESVKERIDQMVMNKKFKAYGDDLMKNAKVEKNL